MEINTLKLAQLLSNHDETITKAAALATSPMAKQASATVAAIGMSHPRCAAIMVKQAVAKASDSQIKRALEQAAAGDPAVADELASFCDAIGCKLEKKAVFDPWGFMQNAATTAKSWGDGLAERLVPKKPELIVPPPVPPPPVAATTPAAPAGTEWYNDPLVWGGGALTAGWLANHRRRPEREEERK